jgi:hypothetical protein
MMIARSALSPMSEVMLQRPGIDAVIGQLEAAGMAQHVGCAWNGSLATALSLLSNFRNQDVVTGPPRSVLST